MSKNNDNEHVEEGVFNPKKDILRANDIIPYLPKSQKPKAVEELSEPEVKAAIPIEAVVPKLRQIKQVEEVGHFVKDSSEPEIVIPKFDLAEDIMAEHRRISAVKRKGPGPEVATEVAQLKPQVEQTKRTEPTGTIFADCKQIIRDIVARDIERLCRA